MPTKKKVVATGGGGAALTASAPAPTSAPVAGNVDVTLFTEPRDGPSSLSTDLRSSLKLEFGFFDLRRNYGEADAEVDAKADAKAETPALAFFHKIATVCDLTAAMAMLKKDTKVMAQGDFRLGYYRAAYIVLHLTATDARRAGIDARDVHKQLCQWAAGAGAPAHFTAWLNTPAIKSAHRRQQHPITFFK